MGADISRPPFTSFQDGYDFLTTKIDRLKSELNNIEEEIDAAKQSNPQLRGVSHNIQQIINRYNTKVSEINETKKELDTLCLYNSEHNVLIRKGEPPIALTSDPNPVIRKYFMTRGPAVRNELTYEEKQHRQKEYDENEARKHRSNSMDSMGGNTLTMVGGGSNYDKNSLHNAYLNYKMNNLY